MKAPPLLPAETLERVLRHARLNGSWVLIVATFFGLLGAVNAEVKPMVGWLLIAGTGAMALHGFLLLNAGNPRGTGWLVGAEVSCMLLLLGICAWQLTHIDLGELRPLVTPELRESFRQLGMQEDEGLLASYYLSYAFLAVLALAYPGGLALYFHRRRAAVTAALDEKLEE